MLEEFQLNCIYYGHRRHGAGVGGCGLKRSKKRFQLPKQVPENGNDFAYAIDHSRR